MKIKLQKTLLSQKISVPSICIGIMSFCVLFIFHLIPTESFSANYDLVVNHQEWWRAFTTSFVHADLKHFGTNALFFTILSVALHQYFGWFMHPFVSLIMGAVINLITLSFYPQQTFLVGISGVVYFMGAFWLTMLFFIERKYSIGRRLLHSSALCLMLFFPDLYTERVSHLAHGVGFILGLSFALLYFAYNRSKIRAKEEWLIEEEIEEDFFFEEEKTCEACSS